MAIRGCEGGSQLLLGLARGLQCNPSQVLITMDSSRCARPGDPGLELGRIEGLDRGPSFPLARTALGLAGMAVTAVPVDAEGLDVPLVSSARSKRNWQL